MGKFKALDIEAPPTIRIDGVVMGFAFKDVMLDESFDEWLYYLLNTDMINDKYSVALKSQLLKRLLIQQGELDV